MQSFLYHANVVGTMAARRAKVPRVVTGIRVADPSRWRSRVERWLSPKMDKIVCVSQGVADFCRQRGFPAEKLVVIPNSVDVARFAEAQPVALTQFGIPPNRRVIIYVGRLDRQKGIDWLLSQVMPSVLDEERLGCHLLLVGDGPQRQELKQLTENRGISASVHFALWQADVPRILAACDLLVLPSRWEGMPNVVLEAMAAGKPVVATQAEGVLELLGEGAVQQSCLSGDETSFRNKIFNLAQDWKLAAELGAQNQRRAAAEFSLTTMVARYGALYESLL